MTRVLLAATALTAFAYTSANATLMVALDVNGTTFNCVDNTGCDTNLAVGTLQVGNQVVNGVTFSGSIQTSTGTVANPGAAAVLNTSSLSIINNNAAGVNIAAAIGDTDFVGPVASYTASVSSTFQQAVGSSFTYNFYDDPTNQQGAQTVTDIPGTLLDTSTKAVTLIADSFSHNASGPVDDQNLFSMTETISGFLTSHGQIVSNGLTEIKSVPEPTGLGILGLGLLGLGFLTARRKTQD